MDRLSQIWKCLS